MAESIKACLIPHSERTKKTINLTKLHITAREYFMHIIGVRQKTLQKYEGTCSRERLFIYLPYT
jgi:hypothetical protein